MSCSVPALRRLVLLLTLAALAAAARAAAPAAEAAKRRFDLAAGDAAVTLRQFAEQSGQQVLYLVPKVRGVATHAVRGEFTARQALERMVATTALVVVEDAQTGALLVQRAPAPEPPRPKSAAAAPDPLSPASSTMIKPPPSRTLLAALAAFLAPSLGAQTAASAPAAAPKPEDAIVLSPFTVTTAKDTGYTASNTLAGTRLNTPVKDLGASISIYTKDFLTDIGATTSNDLMIFATGMEAGGAGGNYSGVVGDINAGEVTAGGARSNAQLTRTRGLGGPNYSRNLFGSGIPLDSYIVDTVTIIRGPNATLFGVGNPAGVVDSTLIKPDLRRDAGKAEFRYGNNDSTRAVLDLNRVIVPGKLAARVASLHDNERYNQRPAFETKKRIFGALTFEPFKSTSIRGNFESGNSHSNRPITVLPFNSISKQWFDAGRPSNDFRFFDDPAVNPNAANVGALTNTNLLFVRDPVLQGMTVVYPSVSARAPNFSFRTVLSDLPVGTTNIADRPLGGVFDSNFNRDRAADGWTWNPVGNVSRLNAPFWTPATLAQLPGGGRGQLPGFVPAGIKTQGFTDLSVFDFKNHQLDETGRQGDSFNVAQIALEQRAWRDRLGVQLEYFTQRRHTEVKDAFFQDGIGSHVFVDVNPTILGNLTPNPNYGRPFAYYRATQFNFGRSKNENLRATAFARYDFKDLSPKLGKWLGRHALSGLVEESSADSVNYGTRFGTAGPGTFSLPGNLFDPLRIGTATVYLGPSLIGNNNPIQLSPIQIPQLTAGPIPVPFLSYQRDPTPTDTGRLVSLPIEWRELLQSGNLTREVIRSQAFALQSNWLDDHLVTIFGWRRDEDYFARRAIAYTPNPADAFDPGKVHYGLGDITFPGTPPFNVAKETKSQSYVARWPQKLLRLPLGSDLSVFFNKSGNFTPQGGRVNQYAEALPSPIGNTKEYGFNLSFLNDRFSVRVNRYETKTIGQGSSPAAFGAAIQNISIASTASWLLEANSNPGNAALIAQSRADAEKYFAALPSNYRSLYNFTISGTAPNLTSSFLQTIPGATDTVDFTAKGTEVDIVFNPTRRWRILANVAKQETVLSNAFPSTKEFIARMTPVWRELANRPAFNYPPGYVIGTPLPAGTQTLGDRVEQNVLIPFATSVATEGSASPEQRKYRANLVSNYSFGGDSRVFGFPLKGWNVGAGLRWQDKLGLGYPTTRQPDPGGNAARSGPVVIHIDRPYYAPAETNLDAWLGYTRRLWGDRIEWKMQLNVRNLWQSTDDTIGITVQPWGEVASARLAPERRWYLTNTFSF